MDITSFKANFKHGARPNLYRVQVSGINDTLRFMCRGAQLPGTTLGEIEHPYMSRTVKIAGDRTFENWEVTIFNDIDFSIRGELEEWNNGINTHEGNVGHTTMAEYMRDGTVTQLNRDGSDLYTYEFRDIWPSVIAPIELAFDTNDTVEEYAVTFSIGSYWTSPNAS